MAVWVGWLIGLVELGGGDISLLLYGKYIPDVKACQIVCEYDEKIWRRARDRTCDSLEENL